MSLERGEIKPPVAAPFFSSPEEAEMCYTAIEKDFKNWKIPKDPSIYQSPDGSPVILQLQTSTIQRYTTDVSNYYELRFPGLCEQTRRIQKAQELNILNITEVEMKEGETVVFLAADQ